MQQCLKAIAGRLAAAIRLHCLAGAFTAGAVVMLLPVSVAQAETCRQRNYVDALSLTLGVNTMLVSGPGGVRQSRAIRVTSSDGDAYDQIEPTSFRAQIGVDLCYPGALDGIELRLGMCTGHGNGCGQVPQMYFELPSARDFHKSRDFQFEVPTDSDLGRNLLDSCNSVADQAKGAEADIFPSVGIGTDVTLAVDTRRDHGAIGNAWDLQEGGNDSLGDYSKTRSFPMILPFSCAPLRRIAESKAPPQPVAVNLSVDPKGEVCPKETEVTAWIYYDEPAVAQFRFKLDGELSGLYTREAVKVGGHGAGPAPKGKGRDARYLVRETRTYHLDPGQHRFRIEVRGGAKSEVITRRIECPPFKVTSAWLNYGVEDKPNCPKEVDEKATFRSTRPGKAPFEIKTQGGLVVHSGTAAFERKGKAYVATVKRDLVLNAFDQDMMALIKNQPDANSGWTRLKVECLEVLSGTLELREFQAKGCEGEAAFSIRTNMAGGVPYRLDCTGNRSWDGVAPAQQTGPNTFLGVGVKRFDVANNEQVNCALKTDAPLPVRILALKGNKYQCHKPADAGGSSDLAPAPGRPDDLPPARTLAGDFTFIDNGGTRCPRQGKALINFTTSRPDNVHYSLDCKHGSFSGVAQTAKGPKGGYVAPALVSFDIKQTLQASCALKTVAPGKPKVHTLKGHLFQCVKPTGVSGSDNLAPESRPDPRKPDGPGRLVVDPPRTPPSSVKISCAGGTVKAGACSCARTHKPVQAGKNAWRCARIVVVDPPKPKLKVNTNAVEAAKAAAAKKKAEAEARKRQEAAKKAAEAARRAATQKRTKSTAR